MLRATSQLARTGTATHIKNTFYNGLQPPSAVIALNSPTLGDYERRLLSKIFDKFSSNINNSSESTSISNAKRAKPLFLCADGAYSKIAKLPSLLNAVDMVVGDGDSLLWWKQQEASLQQQQQQQQSSVALGGNSSPPAPVSHIVLHHAEHFGDDRHGRSSSSVSQGAVRAVVHEDNVEHFQLLEQSFLRKRALFVRVLDQNTTDFEKCLTVCERVLSSQYWAKATHQHVDDAHADASHQKKHVVLVLGFQGGEWHHEMAALHAGAKYSAGSSSSSRACSSPPSILDLRFHAQHTTIAFCNPNGETIFDRNVDFENKTFALIPFGESPLSLTTTGLKWNLDHHHSPRGSPSATSSSDPPYFGFTNASVRSSYISTSNRITDPDGRVTIQMSGTDACVVALAIHLDATQPPEVHVGGQEGVKKEEATAPRLGVTMLVYRDTDNNNNNNNNNAHQQHNSITTEYLLVQRGKAPSKGLWGCPGGSVEWGEGSLAAAVRELKEETGLVVDGQSLSLPLGRSPVHASDVIVPSEEQQANLANEQQPVRPVEHHFVLMHFAAQLHQEGSLATLKAGDDAAAVAWKSKEEITVMTSEGLCVAGVLDVISAVETARNTAAAAKRSKL